MPLTQGELVSDTCVEFLFTNHLLSFKSDALESIIHVNCVYPSSGCLIVH